MDFKSIYVILINRLKKEINHEYKNARSYKQSG
jgi:hypothetical protein